MDVDGMPWNSKRPWQLLPGDPARESRKKRSLQYAEPTEADGLQDGEAHSDADGLHHFSRTKQDELTKEERRSLVCGRPGFSGSPLAAFLFLFILCKCMVSIKKESRRGGKSANIGFNPHAARSRKHGSAIVRSMITASRSAGS